AERVKNGLANARAKGKHIGRAKLRDSEMIRKLRKAGLTYRAIATIAKCSHGSVHAELLAEKREEALKPKLLPEGKPLKATSNKEKGSTIRDVEQEKENPANQEAPSNVIKIVKPEVLPPEPPESP